MRFNQVKFTSCIALAFSIPPPPPLPIYLLAMVEKYTKKHTSFAVCTLLLTTPKTKRQKKKKKHIITPSLSLRPIEELVTQK